MTNVAFNPSQHLYNSEFKMQIYKPLKGILTISHLWIIFFSHNKICSCRWKIHEWKSGDLPNDSWPAPQTDTVGPRWTSAALHQNGQERCKLFNCNLFSGWSVLCSFRTFLGMVCFIQFFCKYPVLCIIISSLIGQFKNKSFRYGLIILLRIKEFSNCSIVPHHVVCF